MSTTNQIATLLSTLIAAVISMDEEAQRVTEHAGALAALPARQSALNNRIALADALLTYRAIIAEIRADILAPKPITKSATTIRNLRNEINRYAASLARAIGGY